jgi:hypothetical protein
MASPDKASKEEGSGTAVIVMLSKLNPAAPASCWIVKLCPIAIVAFGDVVTAPPPEICSKVPDDKPAM